jgi:hypothetical protein
MAYLVPAHYLEESERCPAAGAQCLAENHRVRAKIWSGPGFGSFQRLPQQAVRVAAVRTEVVVNMTSMPLVMDPSGCYYRVARLKVLVEGTDLATYTAKGLAVR